MRISARRGLLIWAPLGLGSGLAVGLFALLLLRAERATAVDPAPRCIPADPCLAVVIDDVGRDLHAVRELLELDADLTFAVLPHARHTEASRTAIIDRGRELLLHLPMDPLDRSRISDEPVVVGRDGPLESATRRCLDRVPGAVGVNNHMGSALTQDAAALAAVLRPVRERGLFVLDSRTADRSVFCRVAAAQALPCLGRDVFLDDPPTPAELTSAWERAVEVARQRGWAVAIGHPHPATVEALRGLLRRGGVRVVRLSRLLLRARAT